MTLHYTKTEVEASQAGAPQDTWPWSITDDWLKLWAEVEQLRKAVAKAKMSHRRCGDCGHVAYYLDSISPPCVCDQCGSTDTRLISEAAQAARKAES